MVQVDRGHPSPALAEGLAPAIQVDTTATPRHDSGAIFVQTVSDYPLVEAISQNVVKHPVLPDQASRGKLREHASVKYTEKYADYLNLGVVEWRKARDEHEKLGKKAILFVMTDDTKNCDDVAAYLEGTYPDLKGGVLVIHTKNNGEISEAASGKSKEDLDALRKLANEIDGLDNPYRAIVSVLMLKEGWDVRNVTTIVGLRAYTPRATSCRSRRWARPAEDVSGRRGGIRERGWHRCLHGVRGVDSGRRRRAGAQADGRGDRREGAVGGRGGRGQSAKGPRRAGYRNPRDDAADLSRVQKPRPDRPGGDRARAAALPRIQRGRDSARSSSRTSRRAKSTIPPCWTAPARRTQPASSATSRRRS